MTATTTALIASAAKAALAYIKADQARQYGLLRRACIYVDGPGVGKYNYQDNVLGIISPTPNTLILTSEPFPSNSDNWNGADVLPDNLKDGSFGMSLWHDLIVKRVKEIAAANPGATEQEVFAWANALATPLMDFYAEKPPTGFWKRLVYNTLEAARPFYHPLKKIAGKLAAVAVVAGLAGGCKTPPEWTVRGDPEDAAIVWQLDKHTATNAPHSASGVLP